MRLPSSNSPHEPGKWIAALQAALAFALTMFALLWGVSFSFDSAATPPSLEKVVWLPKAEPKPEPKPAPKPEPKPEPKPKPKPEPKPKPKPEPKPKPKPKPKPEAASTQDADIALAQKQKEEEEKRKKEAQKKKEEEERKRREAEEQKRREEEERRRAEEEKQRKREQEEQERIEKERQLVEQKLREEEEARRVARAREVGDERQKIKGRISDRIERVHRHPATVPQDADIETVISFRLVPDGTGRAVLDGLPEIVESSGSEEYDDSVFRAILQARIFPFPRSPELTEEFSRITLRMSPLDR